MIEWRHPSIIAMKGHPYTGKTTLSHGIGMYLRFCTLLRLDEILDSLSPPNYAIPTFSLNDLAFDLLCRVAKTQLNQGISVIIDSPLSSPSHLDRLLDLSSTCGENDNNVKLIIVELNVEKVYDWQMRFEQRDRQENKWYKPQSWSDVENLIKSGAVGSTPPGGFSRLLVNVDLHVHDRQVVQALQALVFCDDDRVVDFQKWRSIDAVQFPDNNLYDYRDLDSLPENITQGKSRFCSDFHRMSNFKQEWLTHEAYCQVCEKPVLSAAYTCRACPLALHDSCAELEVEKRTFTPKKLPRLLQSSPPEYLFPEKHSCISCKEAGKDFDEECPCCIFESHLKCGLVPTILDHEGHKHKLDFRPLTVGQKGEYRCAACGEVGLYAAYGCTDCRVNYHVECVLLPHPVLHEHGGYEHWLELQFSRDEVLEDYLCDICSEKMTPEGWFYHCKDCLQSYHLHCMTFKEDED